jgi:hypothetical protein
MRQEPWQIWCHGWNRYTRRRFDAGIPIIQRISAERQESARVGSHPLSSFISRYESETGNRLAIRPETTPAHHETGSAQNLDLSSEGQAPWTGSLAGPGVTEEEAYTFLKGLVERIRAFGRFRT